MLNRNPLFVFAGSREMSERDASSVCSHEPAVHVAAHRLSQKKTERQLGLMCRKEELQRKGSRKSTWALISNARIPGTTDHSLGETSNISCNIFMVIYPLKNVLELRFISGFWFHKKICIRKMFLSVILLSAIKLVNS